MDVDRIVAPERFEPVDDWQRDSESASLPVLGHFPIEDAFVVSPPLDQESNAGRGSVDRRLGTSIDEWPPHGPEVDDKK